MSANNSKINNLLIALNILPIGTSNAICLKFNKLLRIGHIFINILIIVLIIFIMCLHLTTSRKPYSQILMRITFLCLMLFGFIIVNYLKKFRENLLYIFNKLKINPISNKWKFYKFWITVLVRIGLLSVNFYMEYFDNDSASFSMYDSAYHYTIGTIQTIIELIFVEVLNQLRKHFRCINNSILLVKYNRRNIKIILKKYNLLCDLVIFVMKRNALFLIISHCLRFTIFMHMMYFTICVMYPKKYFVIYEKFFQSCIWICINVLELYFEYLIISMCSKSAKEVSCFLVKLH